MLLLMKGMLRFAGGLLLVLIGWTGNAQSPPKVDAGTVKDHTYHSIYFHFAYPYPLTTKAVDLKTLALSQVTDPRGHAFLLFAAREFTDKPGTPAGVWINVDEIGHYNGQVRTGADYIAKAKRQWQHNYYNDQSIPLTGVTFYRTDFTNSATDYASVVVGVLRGYAIILKFNAENQDHLNALVSSINKIHLE
jgi:hypothetical protein